jgi:hypothetical protein
MGTTILSLVKHIFRGDNITGNIIETGDKLDFDSILSLNADGK